MYTPFDIMQKTNRKTSKLSNTLSGSDVMLFADKSNICNELPKPSNAIGDTYCNEQCLMYSSLILVGRNASSPNDEGI